MIRYEGTEYYAPAEAAKLLGVNPSTLRGYIAKGVLPEAPMIRVGRRRQRGFTEKYIEAARETLRS